MERPGRWEFVLIGSILVASFALQLAILPTKFVGPDTWKFLQIARKQASSTFWSDPSAFDYNYWAIGYPTFLATIFRLAGDSIFIVQVIQTLMVCALALLAWSMALLMSPRVRVFVVVLTAFTPGLWGIARLGGYEILLSLLLCGALALAWWGGGKPAGHRWLVLLAALTSGLVLGLAVLTQSKAIVVLPVLLYLAWRWGRMVPLAQIIGVVLALAPWMLRNRQVLGTWSPFGTNGPINIWIGNNPDNVTGGFMPPPDLPPDSTDFIDAALRYVISQPEAAFALLLRRSVRLVEPVYIYPEAPIPGPIRVLGHSLTILLTAAIVIGVIAFITGRLWVPAQHMPNVGPLAAFVGIFYLVHLPFLAEARFMTPVLPVSTVVALGTYAALWSRYRQRPRLSGSRRSP